MQCFVHFDKQKMLDATADGVFHLLVTLQYVFQVQCFFYKYKICSCSAINFHSDGHTFFF